jgi:hypothetical protein
MAMKEIFMTNFITTNPYTPEDFNKLLNASYIRYSKQKQKLEKTNFFKAFFERIFGIATKEVKLQAEVTRLLKSQTHISIDQKAKIEILCKRAGVVKDVAQGQFRSTLPKTKTRVYEDEDPVYPVETLVDYLNKKLNARVLHSYINDNYNSLKLKPYIDSSADDSHYLLQNGQATSDYLTYILDQKDLFQTAVEKHDVDLETLLLNLGASSKDVDEAYKLGKNRSLCSQVMTRYPMIFTDVNGVLDQLEDKQVTQVIQEAIKQDDLDELKKLFLDGEFLEQKFKTEEFIDEYFVKPIAEDYLLSIYRLTKEKNSSLLEANYDDLIKLMPRDVNLRKFLIASGEDKK